MIYSGSRGTENRTLIYRVRAGGFTVILDPHFGTQRIRTPIVPYSIVSVRHLGVESVEFGLFLINGAHCPQDGLVTNELII